MALKESELRVLAILGLVILILWSFFGLFWSLLLVFTFLVYAYKFGRHRTARQDVVHVQERRYAEQDLSYQEKLHNNYYEPPDLPFTGLPREKSSLRSPMPLLSEVTKRLSFNMSSTTPFQARKSWYNRELAPTPYPSRGNAFTYRRKPNHFSLLNPALQRPSTVKIASPDVTVNKTFTLANSPSKRVADDWNPCSRVTVLSALKETRKRSFVIDEDEDELMRPTKRRDTKPVDSHSFSSPLLCGRKRVAADPESTKTTADENSNKKSKVTDDGNSSEILHTQKQVVSVVQKRKNRAAETLAADVHEDSTETAVDEGPIKKNKVIHYGNSSDSIQNPSKADSVVPKRKDMAGETETQNPRQGDVDDHNEGNQSKTAKNLGPPQKDEEIQREKSEQAKRDDSCLPKQKKRFTVPRFASKEDSRRRAVPVYCASNEESEMPQRRTVTRKINQEQIKIDRRLAWERVKELLDGDEDEEEDEDAGASKPGTKAVSSTAETTTSMSLFKVPTAGAVTSAGTITTTTTQSLITPVPATGGPQGTTGSQKGTVTSTQSSTVPSLQSQQSLGSGLFSNVSSIRGSASSTGLPASTLTGVSQTAAYDQAQAVATASTSGPASLANASAIGTQATIPLTTASANQGANTASSASPFGNSPFTKPAMANQLTSTSDLTHKNTPDTNTSSAQKSDFSFSVIASSGASGTSSNATVAGPGGFNFAAASGTQSAFSLGQKATENTSGTSSFNSPSTFNSGASTAQKPVALTGNSLTTNSQNPFGSFAKPAQSSSVSSASSSPSVFGQNANTAQSSFGSTTQNKATFGATNMQRALGQQGQSPFGSASSLGATPSQNAFGTAVNKSSTQSQFTFGVQAGQNASQSATGTNPVQNAFGVQQQNQQATPSAFGQTNNNAFTNKTADKSGFTFASQVKQSTTQSVFGNQITQNMFGSQPNQNPTQSAFGTQPAQNAFGSQATQSAFGAPANQNSASSFSFATNTAQNASNSPFAGLGNKAGTQSTFGAAPSQNAAGPPGGFNFNAAPGSNPTPGGFNFNTTANKPTGFQFGASGSSSSFGQFGQTTAQPGAAPATPTPSAGFNFAAGSGGMPGSPFASSAAAPTFGTPSTPQAAGSTLTARSRARIAARRRGKK